MLDLLEIHGGHSGENVAEQVIQVLDNYGITEKVSAFPSRRRPCALLANMYRPLCQLLAVVTDNTSSNDTFREHLEYLLRERGLDFNLEDHHVGCGAHVFHLGAKDFLNVHKTKRKLDDLDLEDLSPDELELLEQELQEMAEGAAAVGDTRRLLTIAILVSLHGYRGSLWLTHIDSSFHTVPRRQWQNSVIAKTPRVFRRPLPRQQTRLPQAAHGR